MRVIFALGVLSLLAACASDPAKYGITGPGTQPPPVASTTQSPDGQPIPGVNTVGTTYGPSAGPSTGASGFWGYNN
ncbi:MAG TPA: hypothetical protein VFG12_14915 [Rhodopila sp.]|jgi:hypothetical protein|nr:hypothetical protein [Rhodopila sp.]